MRMSKFLSGFSAAFVLLVSAPVGAESQTPWQDHQGMISTRLIVASNEVASEFPGVVDNSGSPKLLLAWEAKLADGWKTYWRSPGEAGLPVRVFHDGDQVDILYPFPERFELFGLETFGYSKQVAIPFQVARSSEELVFRADFMVCKDICVPFETTYTLNLEGDEPGTIVTDTRVRNSLANVPVRFGDVSGGLKVTSVRYAGKPGYQNLVVEATAERPLSKPDLLAELDETTQFHSPKTRLLADGRSVRFVLPVMSTKKGLDLAGKRVRLTMSDGRGNAVDRFFELPPR